MIDTHTTAHIPDEAVEAAFEAMNPMKSPSECCLYDVKKGLTAALPHLTAPCAVEVVKLDWVKHPTAGAWRACTPFGTYQVWGGENDARWIFDGLDGERMDGKASSADEATAVVQSDFGRRILANIVTKPVDVAAVRRQAFEEAAKVIDGYEEYDRSYCCSGHMCGCYGATVHQHMKHYIRALSAEPAQGDQSGRAALAQEVGK